jgi:hypothetical protein
MSDKQRKTITTLPVTPFLHGMTQTGNLNSMSAYKGFNAPITEFSSKLNNQFFSDRTKEVMNSIDELEKNNLLISENIYEERITLDEQLFDARANVKVLLSKVSMHFSKAFREKLFRQIDLIHDFEEWEEGDAPIQIQSFHTFIRWFFMTQPPRLPNFGLSSGGHFIASWLTNNNKDRLILEFMLNDRIKWFVTKSYEEGADHSSGVTKISRIADILLPYQTDDWFIKEA